MEAGFSQEERRRGGGFQGVRGSPDPRDGAHQATERELCAPEQLGEERGKLTGRAQRAACAPSTAATMRPPQGMGRPPPSMPRTGAL